MAKARHLEGTEVDYSDRAHLLGRAGDHGQHSFYQLIHQGTRAHSRVISSPSPSPLNP